MEFPQNGAKCIVFTLILVHLQSSTSVINFSVCRAVSSIIIGGDCVECLHPEVSMPCLKSYNGSVFTDNNFSIVERLCPERIFLCSRDTELRKVERGKQFLNDRVLHVVTIQRPPFVNLKDGKYTGVIIEPLVAFQFKYNFTLNIFPPYDGNWGTKVNGTWNGMIGQVYRGEADLAASSLSVTVERSKAVAFTTAFHQEPYAILIPAPTAGSKLETLVRPFSPEVWLAMLITVIFLGPTLYLFHTISLRIRGLVDTLRNIDTVRLLTDLFQFTIGSIVQESLKSPINNNNTTKSLVVLWWFCTLIVSNIYTGYMVSFLSAPKLYDLVDSLEGLIKQNKLRWTYRKSTSLEDLIQSNVSPVYNALAAGVKSNDLVSKDMDGVTKVLEGKFAFLKEKSFLDVAISEDFQSTSKCRITIASKTFVDTGFAIAMQKGSVILPLMDDAILRVVTTGLMEKWKALHWPKNLFCINAASYIIKTQSKLHAFTISDSIGGFFILICGLSLSIGSFVVERAIYQGRILYNKPRRF